MIGEVRNVASFKRKLALFLGLLIALVLAGSVSPDTSIEEGKTINYAGVNFTYYELGIRNPAYRTDVFELRNDSLFMGAEGFVDSTFHETHYLVKTDLDLCDYRTVTLQSTMNSETYRTSISPSSQIWIQGIKFSSHSLDGILKVKRGTNLKFQSDGSRLTFSNDEMNFNWNVDCHPETLTIEMRCTGGENGTCLAEMEIFNIELGDKI